MNLPSGEGQTFKVGENDFRPPDILPVLLIGTTEIDDTHLLDLLRVEKKYDDNTKSIIIDNEDHYIETGISKEAGSFTVEEGHKVPLYISFQVREIDFESYTSNIENSLFLSEYGAIILSYDYYNSDHVQSTFEKLNACISKTSSPKIPIIVMELRSSKTLREIATEKNKKICNASSAESLEDELVNLDEVDEYEEKCLKEI